MVGCSGLMHDVAVLTILLVGFSHGSAWFLVFFVMVTPGFAGSVHGSAFVKHGVVCPTVK